MNKIIKIILLICMAIFLNGCDPVSVKIFEMQDAYRNQKSLKHCKNKIVQSANHYLNKEGYFLKQDSNQSTNGYSVYYFRKLSAVTELPFTPGLSKVYIGNDCHIYIFYAHWGKFYFDKKEEDILNRLNNGIALQIKKQLGLAVSVQSINELPTQY